MTASIGDRMKLYERACDSHFTPNSPVVIRVDGKAFHSFLRYAERPFDQHFIDSMAFTAEAVSREMMGFKLAFTQSDECTFVITDYDRHETQGWFDYSLNKIVSITASMFTAYFNRLYENDIATEEAYIDGKLKPVGLFDARAFVIPVPDVPNVFIWRQRDWERNSIQMLTRSHFSHKQCHGRKISDMHEMLHTKGINWATDCTPQQKNGTFIVRGTDAFIHEKLSYDTIAALIAPKEEDADGQ
jgi:tRNA(His) guanylyltransferase